MKKREVRARLQRLISGGRDSRDLDAVLRFMRFHSHGIVSVREVGDFLAHNSTKDKREGAQHALKLGRSFERLITVVRAKTAGIRSPALDLSANSGGLIDRLRLLDSSVVKQELGISKLNAEKLLASVVEKINKNSGELTYDELSVLTWTNNRYPSAPFLFQNQIEADLYKAMVKEELVGKGEHEPLKAMSYLFVLLFLTDVHLCEISREDKPPAILKAGVDLDGLLHVNVSWPSEDNITICFPFLMTTLLARDYVAPGSMPDESVITVGTRDNPEPREGASQWSGPIELVDGQIRII